MESGRENAGRKVPAIRIELEGVDFLSGPVDETPCLPSLFAGQFDDPEYFQNLQSHNDVDFSSQRPYFDLSRDPTDTYTPTLDPRRGQLLQHNQIYISHPGGFETGPLTSVPFDQSLDFQMTGNTNSGPYLDVPPAPTNTYAPGHDPPRPRPIQIPVPQISRGHFLYPGYPRSPSRTPSLDSPSSFGTDNSLGSPLTPFTDPEYFPSPGPSSPVSSCGGIVDDMELLGFSETSSNHATEQWASDATILRGSGEHDPSGTETYRLSGASHQMAGNPSEPTRGRPLSRHSAPTRRVSRSPYLQRPEHVGGSYSSPSRSAEQTGRVGENIVKMDITSSRMRKASEMRRGRDLKFDCDICGERFTTNNKRKRHRNAHLGVKPFSCTIDGCEKAFSSQSDRKRHMEKSQIHMADRSS